MHGCDVYRQVYFMLSCSLHHLSEHRKQSLWVSVSFWFIRVASSTTPGMTHSNDCDFAIPTPFRLLWWVLHQQCLSAWFRLFTLLSPSILTLRTSEAGIPALCKLPCGVRSRNTGFVQTSLWRQKSVYRRHGMSTPGVRSRCIDFVF